MSTLFLAIFLIAFGFNLLVGIALPPWVLGILALIAGLLLIGERFGVGVKKP
jgi:hypothetical protein